MFGIKLAAVFLAAGVIAFAVGPFSIWLAHRVGAVDKPNYRKVHTRVMPRIGGIAIFVGVMVPGLIEAAVILKGDYAPLWGMLLGGLIVFLVGFLDDLNQLSPWVKLGGQCLAAVVTMAFGLRVHFITSPFEGMFWLGYLSIPFTFLWLVGVTNAVNLIDGLDGLAAGVSGIAALSMGIVAHVHGQSFLLVLSVMIAGAVLGFLPYNFHPARTFMGDCGSNFLGFMMAATAVQGMAKTTAVISLLVPILILGVPILDTFFAVIRRMHNKVGIFQPDKNHLHHRLLSMGYSHQQAVLIIYGVSALFGACAVLMSIVSTPKAMCILMLVLIIVGFGVGKTGVCTAKMPPVESADVPENEKKVENMGQKESRSA